MTSYTLPPLRAGRAHALATAILAALLTVTATHATDTTSTAAATPPTPAPAIGTAHAAASKQLDAVMVSAKNSTRSAVSLSGNEIQKILPGASALQAIKTLPGVLYLTADPWGNNEQNASIYVHGFGQQQLGYTMDGVPLGDQQYGNYNGLSPQRAISSENIANVTLYSGAGDIATASTSNLGGSIATFSSDPDQKMGGRLSQTAGSYGTTRTFARFDTGRFGGDNSAYVSILHQDQRAWDFDGHQGGDQINWKFIHDGEHGKLTFFGDYSDKTEPNEDSVYHGTAAGEGTHLPYTRGFSYPDFQHALGYLNANGSTPTADGNNYQDYYSDAQRTDYLTYLKYDWYITDNITWTNQAYFHHDDGAGVVAGPIQVAGLPTLFNAYFPGQNLKEVFGNSGYAIRTTEYDINRRGFLSNLNWDTGTNQFSAGVWWEHNRVSQARRWYPLDVNDPSASTPYTRPDPSTALITQYINDARSDVIQPYISDQWHITQDFSLQAGAKSSFQYAQGWYPVKPLAGSTSGVTAYPNGSINSHKSFLPQFGGTWDITANDQLFFNVQKNMHQFAIANNMSPWTLGSQATFDLFKRTVKPETAWVTELGLRFNHDLSWGPITGIDGQVSGYHVNFANRLLGISSTSVIGSINPGAGIIANVGSVSTNGADMAATLHFGRHFSFYDALSYNDSRYNDDYTSAGKVIPTAGKKIPGSPTWMDKFIASFHAGRFSAQLVGDAVGKIYATYTDDLHVPGYFLLSAQASYALPFSAGGILKDPQVALNIINLADRQAYQVLVGAASGTYSTYPIAPRQFFVTFSTRF